MIIDDSGIIIFSSTPSYLLQAEMLQLNKEFSRQCENESGKNEAIKLLPEQVFSELVGKGPFQNDVKSTFKFTKNGIYAANKVVANDVVQIDVHSMLPTFAYELGLLNGQHQALYNRKKSIEKIDDYQANPKLVQERADIKFQLNQACSTNDSGKGRYVNRLLPVFSSMNFMFDVLNYWGLNNILACLNDGFIMQVGKRFNQKFTKFEQYYQQQIPHLTFSAKKWKYGIIRTPQEYILVNSPVDYKCRNHEFDVNSLYEQKTRQSLRKLKPDEVDHATLALAQSKEGEVIRVLYRYMFEPDIDGLGALDEQEQFKDLDKILQQAGVNDTDYKVPKKHFYNVSLGDDNDPDDWAYQFTKRILRNQVFATGDKLKGRVNLLGQTIKIDEIQDIDDYLDNSRVQVINNYTPSVIDPIGNDQSIEEWLEYEVKKIQQSNVNLAYQYNLLAMTAQAWATLNKESPNKVVNYLTKLRKKQGLSQLDMADMVYNDPNTVVINGQLMVKDSHNVYSSKASVVNHLLKKYMNKKQKQHFDLVKNNVLALLQDDKYQDTLESGFNSDTQTIWLNGKGKIQIDTQYGHVVGHHVNVNYSPGIVNSTEYYQVNNFLKHLAPKQERQLKAMLGLIPLQHTDIMKELRTFLVLKGKSGAGKSTLANLLEKIFNDSDQTGSNIISNTQNVNKAFTDGHYIALNDTKSGMLMLWFDDFQSSSRNNIITANAGTVINGVISGVAQNASAKYERDHPVTLPSLIVIATNSIPQVTQEGTAARMFVIDSPKTLKEDPIRDENGNVIKVADFVNNPKVWQALFYIIMREAANLLKMTNKERAEIFDHKYSAASRLSLLNDSLELFFENQGITSSYDLIGMQANKLFNVYKDEAKQPGVSYRSFTDQLELLGLVLKRKHFNGRNFQKVICSVNDQLTQEKMKAMLNDRNILPDQVNSVDLDTGEIRSLKTWHHGYENLKSKYPHANEVFTPFKFSN